jgi:hypothetical protein
MARSFANARKTKQKKFSSIDRQLLQGFDQESDNGHSKAPHAKRERMKEKVRFLITPVIIIFLSGFSCLN